MEQKLWAYIDGAATAKERLETERLLEEHHAWRSRYQELLHLHQMIKDTALEQPSMGFTHSVMEAVTKYHTAPAARNYINKRIIRGIAAFFFLVIGGLLIYGFSQLNRQATGGNKSFAGIEWNELDYSPLLSGHLVNALIMGNIVLGLMLLDRYLAQRRRRWKAI